MRLRPHRRTSALPGLPLRLESGDPTAYEEIGPSVRDQAKDSVWDQVRPLSDPHFGPEDNCA